MLGSFLAFIINLVLDFYVFLVLLRIVLQKLGANWYNPLMQFVLRFTEPVAKPLRRVIPSFRGIDYALVVLAVLVEVIEVVLNYGLSHGVLPGFAGGIVIVLASLLGKTLNLFFFVTVVWAILSWFSAMQHHPLAEAVGLIALPLLRTARRVLPLIGGIDLSPILVILVLQGINLLLVAPLMQFGLRLAF